MKIEGAAVAMGVSALKPRTGRLSVRAVRLSRPYGTAVLLEGGAVPPSMIVV